MMEALLQPNLLQPIEDLLRTAPGDQAAVLGDDVDYLYQGTCPRTGQFHSLPRTALARAVARGLMAQLAQSSWRDQEGKMIGILLVQTADGQTRVLKAFSGDGQAPGWVPSGLDRDRVALQEAQTLHQLSAIKTRLLTLQHLAERQTYGHKAAEFAQRRQALNQCHRQRKQARARQRQLLLDTLADQALAEALAALDQASRGDKAELRALKQSQTQILTPLATRLKAADEEIIGLKRQRRALSRQLQANMHAAYTLTNFAGETAPIQTLATEGNLPTGTGDCCAPKLLQFAARHCLQPLAMAEFWWEPGDNDTQTGKQSGEFYGACQERCQPIMGFLLAGVAQAIPAQPVADHPPTLPILYEDDWLIVVDKPAGLLSVPGRYADRQDSVLTRLRGACPNGEAIYPVHRLDQATSGVLVLARTPASQRYLCQQFQQRQVEKIYEAILEGHPAQTTGTIDLPLWGNPARRPWQEVHWQWGKLSQTRFEVISQAETSTRVAFFPITGRTHQIRVHAAHPAGLNVPIRGDRLYGLYGQGDSSQRLFLHAKEIRFSHPHSHRPMVIQAPDFF